MKQQKSFQPSDKGNLFLVPTPIGNLDDMTFRAVNTLKSVDIIAAEDTRHTQKLLNHFSITTSQISFHEHNTKERIPFLIDKMLRGENVAQVSDAGMPSISDPGHELVKSCIEENINVIALPGANAALTALIASGLMPQPFYFHGFLPRKKNEQEYMLNDLKQKKETLIFYESPFRIRSTLQQLSKVFHPNRKIVVCRELTKRYEEYSRGTIDELQQWCGNSDIKGEICLLVEGITRLEQEELNKKCQQQSIMPANLSVVEQVVWAIDNHHYTTNEAIKYVAKQLGKTKREVYTMYHKE